MPPRSSLETPGSGPIPSDDADAGRPFTRTQQVESERDGFGTIVNKVTVVTTTITTSERYRLEDA